MPELPEVETIRNQLLPKLSGRRLTGVELFRQKALHGITHKDLNRRIQGQRIEAISRRGKYLLIRLSSGQTLMVHLKMTGVLLLRPAGEQPGKYTTAIFRLDGDADLHFIDQRKFGSIWLVDDEREVIGKLGPEPLGSGFTPTLLRGIAARHRIPVKALLLDQGTIAGIGNMWADEALFAARIHPLKPACELTGGEIRRLHGAIIEVLNRGIRHNGASVSTYRLPDGQAGSAQTEFRVAHRRGQDCLICGTSLSYVKVRGRGTCFCSKCQPA